MLGDAGVDNSDVSYTGDVSNSVFSLDYVRQKGRDFQVMLQSLDTAYSAGTDAINSGALDDDTVTDISNMLADYDSQRFALTTTAEAFNAGAAVVNGLGGRLPVLSIPPTLGVLPALVLPAGLLIAVATAATLITWGVAWINGLNSRLATAQLLDGATPDQRTAIVNSTLAVQAAQAASQSSPLASIANIVKYGAIAALVFMAYRAFVEHQK